MAESESEDKNEYSKESVINLMNEEEKGLHISLVDSGRTHEGSPVMNIVMQSDLDIKTIKNIMEGLLTKYEEEEYSE